MRVGAGCYVGDVAVRQLDGLVFGHGDDGDAQVHPQGVDVEEAEEGHHGHHVTPLFPEPPFRVSFQAANFGSTR